MSLYPTRKGTIWQGLTFQPQRITHVKPQDQSFLSPVIENVKAVDLLRSRKVAYPWTNETHFKVAPDACGKSVLRTSARIVVPVSDVNPMAIADSGASHVMLPQAALYDTKAAKPVNLRLAAGEVKAIEAHREIFAEHVTIPLCPLGRVIRKLQLAAIWPPPPPQILTLSCVNKSGTAQGLMSRVHRTLPPYNLDATPSSSTPAQRAEALSSSILERAISYRAYRRSRLEDGGESARGGAPDISRYDKVQFTTSQLVCHQDSIKSRPSADSTNHYHFETFGTSRLSRPLSNVIICVGIESTTQRTQCGRRQTGLVELVALDCHTSTSPSST